MEAPAAGNVRFAKGALSLTCGCELLDYDLLQRDTHLAHAAQRPVVGDDGDLDERPDDEHGHDHLAAAALHTKATHHNASGSEAGSHIDLYGDWILQVCERSAMESARF